MTAHSTEYEDNGKVYEETSTCDISYDEDFSSAIRFVTNEQGVEKIMTSPAGK